MQLAGVFFGAIGAFYDSLRRPFMIHFVGIRKSVYFYV